MDCKGGRGAGASGTPGFITVKLDAASIPVTVEGRLLILDGQCLLCLQKSSHTMLINAAISKEDHAATQWLAHVFANCRSHKSRWHINVERLCSSQNDFVSSIECDDNTLAVSTSPLTKAIGNTNTVGYQASHLLLSTAVLG